MQTALEYAPDGLLGVLTPQANTTAEQEFAILLPPRTGIITARLTSDKPTIDARLADYVISMERTLDRFANAPLGAALFACTGASYLVDIEEERAKLTALQEARGYPIFTAANAIADALQVLGARRVGIVSPYSGALHDEAIAYWQRRGLDVASVRQVTSDDAAFHPIYALAGEVSASALDHMDIDTLEAIVLLGTGLPTLPAILRRGGAALPILSPNLCLIWRGTLALKGTDPTAESLRPWLSGAAWAQRFRERTGT